MKDFNLMQILLTGLVLISAQAESASFTNNNNGTVTDADTGLMWQAADNSTGTAWEGALSYCEGLSLASFSDWRLPDIKELRSIVDFSQINHAIDSTYFSDSALVYWSSTTSANFPSKAWTVDFTYGNVIDKTKTLPYLARCVRS